jgi:hypothetical protein
MRDRLFTSGLHLISVSVMVLVQISAQQRPHLRGARRLIRIRPITMQNIYLSLVHNRLSGLAVRVPGYRSRGSGSIPGATTYSEK